MAEQSEIRIGRWRLDVQNNQLVSEDETVALEPLAATVLEYLASRAGEVVSADELTETLWPRKFVGDSPVYRIIADLRRALGDDARHPEFIATIRKRGYKLVAETNFVPTTGNAVQETQTADESAGGPATAKPPQSRQFAGAAILLLAGLAAVTVYLLAGEPAPPVGPETIAVLPFEDLSADGNDEHLGDGLAEVLIHQLSQIDDLSVIARNSSFAYKGRNVDIREIGQTLGASSVLEGSVQRGDGTLRIAAQLIDAETGSHVWSKLFDVAADDLFVVQDELAAAVVNELAPATSTAIRTAAERPALDAYELYLLGRHKIANLQTAEAVELFRRAIARDADFALAYSGLADALLEGIYLDSQALDDEASFSEARNAIARAIELAPHLAEPYASRLLLASREGKHAEADTWYREALERDPAHIRAHVWYLEDLLARAWSQIDRGHLEEAVTLAAHAEQLDPLNVRLKQNLAYIARLTGDHATAERLLKEVYRLSGTAGEAAQALGSLGFLYLDREKFDVAVGYLQLARTHGGDDVGVYMSYLARAHLLMQDYESARRWLEQIERPYEPWPLFIYLDLLLLSGDDDRLIEEVDLMLARSENDPNLPHEEAQSLAVFFLGNTGHCDRLFDVTADMDMAAYRVREPAGDCVLAACYREAGMEDKALEHLEFAQDYVRRVRESGIVTLIDRYVATWVYALEEDRDATLDGLETMYELGLRAPDFLARDRVLGQYREDERFVRVLADMRRDVSEMRRRVFRAEQSGDWFSLVDVEPLPALR
ncbi:MAG: winged helix-turn-helix domain-containing protein [Pseudomonadota bacterium]